MKIAITGHTAGIGQALTKVYEQQGHQVVGLSRRNGFNIRSIPKVAAEIEPCDVFISNAQVGFAQTELLFEMVKRWQGTGKHIILISTIMCSFPVSQFPGLEMAEYYVQKTALEEAVKQIRQMRLGVRMTIVRPGDIATTPDKTVPPSADVDRWASKLVDILTSAGDEFSIPEVSLGPRR